MDGNDSTIESSNSESADDLTADQVEAKLKINARMALVNEKYGSPENRAEPILNKLQELLKNEDSWDVVCACTAFLGQVAPLYMLDQEVKQLGFQVQLVHYFKIDIPGLK